MDIQELNTVIADFVQVGYMQAVKAYEPPQDFVRVSEVKQWLKMMRIDIKRFNRLVSEGVIRVTRKGTGRNSPLYYSTNTMNKIEIIPWVKFNDPGVKQEIEKLAEKSTSKMDFLSRVKDQYNLSLSDAKIVADKFFKKEV